MPEFLTAEIQKDTEKEKESINAKKCFQGKASFNSISFSL